MFTPMQGNQIGSCDPVQGGTSLVQAWGGQAGKDWSYKAKRWGIKQIIITRGNVIVSVAFKDDDSNKNASKFGGDGGAQTDKVIIDFPSEFLTGISGTYGSDVEPVGPGPVPLSLVRNQTPSGPDVVTSLNFYTNQTRYGPFGTEWGKPFSFWAEGGIITGFHGRADLYLDAIGVYVKPVSTVFKMIEKKPLPEMDLSFCQPSPGPWGSINGGADWDDGVFSAVKQVQVHVRRNTDGVGVISAVRFEYQKRGGGDFLSPIHGQPGEDIVNKIEIDGPSEILIWIEGYYGPIEGNGDVDVITSLTFHTNKGMYGPMGTEIGTYFTSMNSSEGTVVGFHGKSGAYLNAIGVHTEYDSSQLKLDPRFVCSTSLQYFPV